MIILMKLALIKSIIKSKKGNYSKIMLCVKGDASIMKQHVATSEDHPHDCTTLELTSVLYPQI
jgi:hypothetical protein